MKPWEGEEPTEAPPVGTVLRARVRVGKGQPVRPCLVTASGVYQYTRGPLEGTSLVWAHGRWQKPDGTWSKPERMLLKPWHEVQLDALEEAPCA